MAYYPVAYFNDRMEFLHIIRHNYLKAILNLTTKIYSTTYFWGFFPFSYSFWYRTPQLPCKLRKL